MPVRNYVNRKMNDDAVSFLNWVTVINFIMAALFIFGPPAMMEWIVGGPAVVMIGLLSVILGLIAYGFSTALLIKARNRTGDSQADEVLIAVLMNIGMALLLFCYFIIMIVVAILKAIIG